MESVCHVLRSPQHNVSGIEGVGERRSVSDPTRHLDRLLTQRTPALLRPWQPIELQSQAAQHFGLQCTVPLPQSFEGFFQQVDNTRVHHTGRHRDAGKARRHAQSGSC